MPQPAAPRRRRARRAIRLLRGRRLHPARVPRGQTSAIVRSFMAHHQGMSLLSLSHLLLGRPMQRRFASEPLFKATLLLLQERIPKIAAFYSHPAELSAIHGISSGPEAPVRVLGTPHTPIPEVQLLSNGRYHVMVTNAGGGATAAGRISPSRAGARTPPATTGARFCYLRDVASGAFWSTAHQPTGKRPQHYEAIFTESRAEFRRRDDDFEIAHRDRRLAGGRHRAAPDPHHQPFAHKAHDRRDQLCGGRARAARRGRAASGVLQSLRADRDRCAATGDPVHAAVPVGGGAATVDVPPDGRARRRCRRRLLRD